MAGSSFVNETCHSHFADLKYVNRRLEWNPHPLDRGEAMQERWWDWMDRRDSDTVSVSGWRCKREHALEKAKKCAERYARPLANYRGGRIILDAEDPGEHASDYSFWFARAEYYRLEHEKFKEEDYHQASRSVTPGVAYPGVPWYTELDRAKCEAGNVARMLADFPAGKALLEAEDHGNLTKDGDYWWSLENFQKPPPEVEDHGDSITDPDYWRSKKKLYSAQLKVELERTKLERAKRSADLRARDLATFPTGKALLEAEDHGDSATDAGYWWNKKKYYEAEYDKLQEEFWERWKRTHLEIGETPLESLEGGECPPEVLNTFRPKTRARKSSVPVERRSARVTRSTTQRGKGTDRPPLGAIASSPNSDAGINSTKDARSIKRRQRKNKYRRQHTEVVERTPPSLPPVCSVAQTPYNGYATPRSDESRIRRPTVKELCKGSIQQRRHKVTDKILDGEQKSYLQSQNPYMTPSSPDFSIVRARQRRKRKDVARQKRRLDGDSTYLESRAVSQPISSRLRSSTGLPGKGTL